MTKSKKGTLSSAASTSMGPFYKKRGYASSQLEVRREMNNPRTAHDKLQNPIVPYERAANLYVGYRDLGSNGHGNFQVEIFQTKRG
jgi:hypothetical protein